MTPANSQPSFQTAQADLEWYSTAAWRETHTSALTTLRAGEFVVVIATDTTGWQEEFGPRFDILSAVTSVQWKNSEFLHPWGLCDEIGLSGLGVLGYEESPSGKPFLKIGVGRLEKEDELPYQFWRKYPVHSKFPTRLMIPCEGAPSHLQGRSLRVEQTSEELDGWSYEYAKSYHICSRGILQLLLELTNTGQHPFTFEHYNHNFFRFGKTVPGPEYILKTKFPFAGPHPSHPLWHEQSQALSPHHRPTPGNDLYHGVEAMIAARENVMCLHHTGIDKGVRITGDYPAERLALWASSWAISPEVFFRATLTPGEKVAWKIRYEFWKDEKPRPNGDHED